MLQKLLLNAAQDGAGETIYYYFAYDGKPEEATEDDKSISVEVAKNEQESTCFLTTIYTSAILAASRYEASEHVQFQVITPSMVMRNGTIEMIEAIVSGGHTTLNEVSLLIHLCPVDDKTDVTSESIFKDLQVYLSKSLDDTPPNSIGNMTNISLVTKESFFAHLLSTGEKTVPNRMVHWTDALEKGVEDTNGCPETVERTSIVEFYDGLFVARIEKGDSAVNDTVNDVSKDSPNTVNGYIDKSCVYSILAAFGEMPLVCAVEHLWPNRKFKFM